MLSTVGGLALAGGLIAGSGLTAVAGGLALAGSMGLSAWRNRGVLSGPEKGQAGLENLPREEWWRLIINPKDFGKAERASGRDDRLKGPGDYYGFYDEDDEPKGKPSHEFRESMTHALESELLFSGGNLGRRVDYDEYVRMHDLVTGRYQSGAERERGTRDSMRRASSVETATGFPIEDWTPKIENESELKGRRRFDIAEDLEQETINGVPLVQRWKGGKVEPNTSVTFFVPEDEQIRVNYSAQQGKRHVTSILDRYYGEVGKAKDDDAKLSAIVRAVRALHITHPFRDANGRLHGQILLNKFLLEQGFSPAILPEPGLGAFGGVFSVPQLVAGVKEGMANFRERAQKPREGKKAL